DPEPAVYWVEPDLDFDPAPEVGPVLVTLEYTVRPENAEAFHEAMQRVRLSRRRSGAVRWDLFRHGEEPERFVESYVVATWGEHLGQHHTRLAGADRGAGRAARALAEGRPVVQRLFPASLDVDERVS